VRKTPLAIGSLVLALLLGAWLLYGMIDRAYLTPRRTLAAQIESTQANLTSIRQSRADQKRIDSVLQSYVDRTLGGDVEVVDHKLRSRLSRLVEQVNLQDHVVGPTRAGKPVGSPAKALFRGAQRELGEETDFVEIECPVSGWGTLEQVLQLVDAIEAEHWIKRIDELRLDPTDNGAKVRVNLRLTTLYLPQGKPKGNADTMPIVARPERYAALLANNPFRVPPPAPKPPESKPAVPGEFQYGQWTVTGVAQNAAGPEVWLLNRQTKETRHLNAGDKLHELVFVQTNGETAEFQLALQRFVIEVGKNLNDRKPVNH
jgi:hypothetical protein